MSVRFVLYTSGEVNATLDPVGTLDPDTFNGVIIDLGADPLSGKYDLFPQTMGRGSRIQTIGGVVDQDFGVFECDRTIQVVVENTAISQANITLLQNAFETVDGQYYFTDSVNCWAIKFARPGGFSYIQDLRAKHYGHDIFNYELNLNVISKDI